MVAVPDPRLDWLSAKYQPKKTTPTLLEFTDVGAEPKNAGADLTGLLALPDLRNCEGLALVLDHFSGEVDVEGVEDLELATVVADLDLVSRRLEKLVADRTRGLKEAEAEIVVMKRLKTHLESELPLRTMDLSLEERGRLRGYQFLTLKPVLGVEYRRGSCGINAAAGTRGSLRACRSRTLCAVGTSGSGDCRPRASRARGIHGGTWNRNARA